MFKNVIVKTPCPSVCDGITSAPELGKPIYEKALEQHASYIEALKKCGVNVTVLPADDNYPDSCFLLGTGYKSVDNSAIYDVHLQSGGYLMGVVAALATESNKVGVVGGANAAEIYRGHEAFKEGVHSVNPDIEIQEV